MAAEYHVRIKKDYAVEVIEDLEKKGAIELIEPGSNQGGRAYSGIAKRGSPQAGCRQKVGTFFVIE